MRFNNFTKEAADMVATPVQLNIDNTPLVSDELAFQCLALTKAAVLVADAPVREVLLFVLLDKTQALYQMLSEEELTD